MWKQWYTTWARAGAKITMKSTDTCDDDIAKERGSEA